CDEFHVTDHEPEALYPAEQLSGSLAAATRGGDWQVVLGILCAVLYGVALIESNPRMLGSSE
ncbi:MAG: hypothetical protein ACYTFI_24835, partial [Planctomycetota bacterium]